MSRGYGKVQRQVIAALTISGGLSTRELAGIIFETTNPTTTQLSSVRRAVSKLETAGKLRSRGRVAEIQK